MVIALALATVGLLGTGAIILSSSDSGSGYAPPSSSTSNYSSAGRSNTTSYSQVDIFQVAHRVTLVIALENK